jgi:UDP-N-acetylmuramate dehydrogenase
MNTLEYKKNVSLAPLNTLGVGGDAEFFVTVTSDEEVREAVSFAKQQSLPITVLGGGSNILVADEGVQGLVIHMTSLGISSTVFKDTVELTVGAGEKLDDVVAYCVDHGLWGIENLSHIPGSIGASVVQNVGAYGVEAKDVITSVKVYDSELETFKSLSNTECAFGYRDSLFKSTAGKKYIVCAVTLRVSTVPNQQVSYKDLANLFKDSNPSLSDIRNAVITIRAGKFPDWHTVGTAGSFFKNPIIPSSQFVELKKRYPELPGFEVGDELVKIPLGWILDKALELRGYQEGNVSTYEHQALVLVAKENATALEIEKFANNIVQKIKNEIGVVVEWEVTKIK